MKRLHIFCKELLRRSAGHLDVVHIVKQALNKPRAIDPFFIVTTVFVRRFHPFINESVQGKIGKTVRVCFQVSAVFDKQLSFGTGIGRRQRSICRFHHHGLVLAGRSTGTRAGCQENHQATTAGNGEPERRDAGMSAILKGVHWFHNYRNTVYDNTQILFQTRS